MHLCSAVQLSLSCLASTDQEESSPRRSCDTHQLQSPGEDAQRQLLPPKLQHAEDCPARIRSEHLLLLKHANRVQHLTARKSHNSD